MTISFIRYNMISRSSGKNAVASAAYRSGSRLRDHQSGKVKNYTRKEEVKYSEIDLPRNCTEKYRDRETLWNAVEQQAKRKDARLARELIVALPVELTLEDDIKVLKKYIQTTFVDDGMISDWSVHWKDDNPHCHLMLTTKPLGADGETFIGQKTSVFKLDENGNRIPRLDENGNQITDNHGRKKWVRTNTKSKDWDNPANGDKWKQKWANTLFKETGIRIEFGVKNGLKAEKHEGRAARQIEENGGISDVCEYNRQVRAYNNALIKQRELERKEKQLQDQLQASIATMEDVVSDICSEIDDSIQKYNVVSQLSSCREIPHLYEIYGKYRRQIDDYVARRPKLQGRPVLQTALIALKSGAKSYQQTLYNNMNDDQPQPMDQFTAAPPKKHHGHSHGRKQPQPLINLRKAAAEIDFQSNKEKARALHDYEEAERAAERVRRQQQDDFDM